MKLYMFDTLLLASDRERLLVMLKLPKLLDYEEMVEINEAPTEKETN